LPVATINNRLHAARSILKKKVLTMVTKTLQSSRLPDDFANRIGRLVAGRGSVVDALFDPGALPDLLTEITVSDETHRDAVRAQVVQRLSGGVVRAVGAASVDAVPRGATVLSSGRHTETTVRDLGIERILPLLAHPPAAQERLLETGIKVIDVLCPMIVGGSVALAGEPNAGLMVLMGELVRRLGGGVEPLSLLVLWPPPSSQWPPSLEEGFSHAETLHKHGHTEGTVGPLRAYHLRGMLEWTTDCLSVLNQVDVTIHLSRAMGQAGIYPTVQPLTSRSRAFDTGLVSEDHAAIANRVRGALDSLAENERAEAALPDPISLGRARKLQNFFAQPFFMTEQYTKRPGCFVTRSEALRGCREILDGMHDDLPPEVFYFTGGMEDVHHHNGG
jgi:F0F1-type ATP synthase beta subunit